MDLGAGADHWLISTQVDFTARGGGKDVVAVADYSATSATLSAPAPPLGAQRLLGRRWWVWAVSLSCIACNVDV